MIVHHTQIPLDRVVGSMLYVDRTDVHHLDGPRNFIAPIFAPLRRCSAEARTDRQEKLMAGNVWVTAEDQAAFRLPELRQELASQANIRYMLILIVALTGGCK